jgi:hypothetical protein
MILPHGFVAMDHVDHDVAMMMMMMMILLP